MREMSTRGLTLLLPFAELCLRQVPRDWSVPLGALQKLPRGAKGLCAQPGQLPLAEQRGDFSLRPGALNVFRDLTGEQAAWDSRGP